MGSGASKKESDDDQEIDTGEFEPIKNWQGEVSTSLVDTVRTVNSEFFLKKMIVCITKFESTCSVF